MFFLYKRYFYLAYQKNGTQDPMRAQDAIRTQSPMRTQDPMRTQNPTRTQDLRRIRIPRRTHNPMRTQNPMRTRTLGGPRSLSGPGPKTLWGFRILWWPRKDPGTYKLAKVSWFPHHVFNLVEITIRFIYHCWMQINLGYILFWKRSNIFLSKLFNALFKKFLFIC